MMIYKIGTLAAFVALGLIAMFMSNGSVEAYDGFFLAGFVMTLMIMREFFRRSDMPLKAAVADIVRPADKARRRQFMAAAVFVALSVGVMGTGAIAELSGGSVATTTTVLAH